MECFYTLGTMLQIKIMCVAGPQSVHNLIEIYKQAPELKFRLINVKKKKVKVFK